MASRYRPHIVSVAPNPRWASAKFGLRSTKNSTNCLKKIVNCFRRKADMIKQIFRATVLTLICINSAFALSLKDAKAQGLVGERNDGYVGYVVKPASAEVKALVKEVNNKRKAKFQSTASNNKISVEQVAALFYERAVNQTQAGHYYQNASGSWVKK